MTITPLASRFHAAFLHRPPLLATSHHLLQTSWLAVAPAGPRNPWFRSRFGNVARSSFTRAFTNSRMHGTAVDSAPAAAAAAVTSRGFGIARFYLQMLDKNPILTKSITAGTIYTVADVTSQGITMTQLEQRETFEWDIARTLRMAIAGLFMSGPTLHLWFNLMSKTYPKRDLLSTLKKMVLGQTLYGPCFTVIFFSLNAFAQGETATEIVARLKRDFFPTIRSGLMYWPLCDFITYRYIPVHLQPLVSNSFSYIWTVYFTYMASLKKVAASHVS